MTIQEIWLEPVLLEGKHIRLEPLEPALHAAPMFEWFDAQALTFTGTGYLNFTSVAAFQTHLEEQISRSESVHWAVRMLATGAICGRVLLFHVQAKNAALELGTLLMPAFWGSQANAESKLLLLTRAFEVLGANRVQFTIDAENLRSIGSINKLGATKEGMLRQSAIRADGLVRDKIIFSVLQSEWQMVKARLEARVKSY